MVPLFGRGDRRRKIRCHGVPPTWTGFVAGLFFPRSACSFSSPFSTWDARPTMQDANGNGLIGWSNERVTKLQKLWLVDGLSASLCAGALGGTTRNAVISKLHRLGLSGYHHPRLTTLRSPSKRSMRRTRPAFPAKPVSPLKYLPAPLPSSDDRASKSFADLEDSDCRFPVGDVGTKGFGFCAKPKFPGFPYCPTHTARCYTAVPVRTRQTEPVAPPAETKEPVVSG